MVYYCEPTTTTTNCSPTEAEHAHTWLHGDLEDAPKNHCVFFKLTENGNTHGIATTQKEQSQYTCKTCWITINKIDYDLLYLYVHVWRLFVELSHEE